MKLQHTIYTVFLLLTYSQFAVSEIERSILTSNIQDREPVDDLGSQVLSDGTDTQKVFFFTHAKDLAGQQLIHRWFYGDEEMAAITLNIGSNDWRTYSSKRLLPDWQGQWKIQVWQGDLHISEHSFAFTHQ